MDPAALELLNHTNDKDFMSNLYTSTTTQRPSTDLYPVFSSLRTEDSKRKGLWVSFVFFQKFYLPDRRVKETVATVGKLRDDWKPGAMDTVPPFMINSISYLSVAICFSCLISSVCWCNICCSSENLSFVTFLCKFWVRSKG